MIKPTPVTLPAWHTLAPHLCRHCRRALWWQLRGTLAPVLVDVEGREVCAPFIRYRGRRHEQGWVR